MEKRYMQHREKRSPEGSDADTKYCKDGMHNMRSYPLGKGDIYKYCTECPFAYTEYARKSFIQLLSAA